MDCRARSHDLVEVIENLGTPQLLVVGDLILDRYTWGDAERVSQEAPVILLRAQRREDRLGGAANVAHMIASLGGNVSTVGVTGKDSDAQKLRDLLLESGIHDSGVIGDPLRPTTVKERFIGQIEGRHAHQMLRVDHEVRHPIDTDLESELCDRLEMLIPDQDLILVSDYDKGVCTPRVMSFLIQCARKLGVPVIVDPCRTSDYEKYRYATAITPNRLEAQAATGQTITEPEVALKLAEQLQEQLDLNAAIITLDADGIAFVDQHHERQIIPTRKRQVYDITGAGDMVLAMIGLCLAGGCDYQKALGLANTAGGLEVERVGVAVLTRQEIIEDLKQHQPGPRKTLKVLPVQALLQEIRQHRQDNQKMVFTNGCFDLLHVGHITYLQEAAALGDYMVVAINSDSSVRQLKGEQRPVISQKDRAAMLAAMEVIDYVVIFDELTPHTLLEQLKPEILVKGGTYSVKEVVGREIVENYGGRVVVTGCTEGISTSDIIEQVKTENKNQVHPPHTLTAPHSESDTITPLPIRKPVSNRGGNPSDIP